MYKEIHKNDYFLEGDEEAARLRTMHQIHREAQNGRLILADVDFSTSDMKILDSGTSDGTWLFDLRNDVASSGRKHTYIGTDVTAERFPKEIPGDMSFQLQDINKPWPQEMNGSIDLVHQRLTLAGSGANTKGVIMQLCDLVKPGGWIQLIEAEQSISENDGPAMRQFLALITEVFNFMGTGIEFPAKMKGWLEEAGFVKTGEATIPSTVGAKVPNKELRTRSIDSAAVALTGLVNFAKTLPNFKSLTPEELDTLIPRFKEEMEKQGGYYPMRAAWGQKPVRAE